MGISMHELTDFEHQLTDGVTKVRDHVLADRTFDKGRPRCGRSALPAGRRLKKTFASDRSKFLKRHAAAGLRRSTQAASRSSARTARRKFPNYRHGRDGLLAVKRYEDVVSLPLAAAEFGETPDEFTKSLPERPRHRRASRPPSRSRGQGSCRATSSRASSRTSDARLRPRARRPVEPHGRGSAGGDPEARPLRRGGETSTCRWFPTARHTR